MTDKDKEARLAAALRENLRKRKAATKPAEPRQQTAPEGGEQE